MIQKYEFLEYLMKELKPFFILYAEIMILNIAFKIAKNEIKRGGYIEEIARDLKKRRIKKEIKQGKETETKNIDEDLQKYKK